MSKTYILHSTEFHKMVGKSSASNRTVNGDSDTRTYWGMRATSTGDARYYFGYAWLFDEAELASLAEKANTAGILSIKVAFGTTSRVNVAWSTRKIAWKADNSKTSIAGVKDLVFVRSGNSAYHFASLDSFNNYVDIPVSAGIPTYGISFLPNSTSKTFSCSFSIDESLGCALYVELDEQYYSVSYNSNGGAGAPAAQTKTLGEALTLSSTVPSRTGYAFTGWNTAIDGTGTSYNPGASYTADEDVTLYAQWAEGYTVSFDPNGGSADIPTQTKYKDIDLVLTSSIPSRTGYSFAHWNTAANDTGTIYASGSTYTGNAELKLYAIWKANNYTITYDTLSLSKTVTYGQKIGTLPSTSKAGYTFDYWSYNGTKITSDTLMTYASNITLTASFSTNDYTVTFDANGGTCDTESITVAYDDYYPALPEPAREGYTFGGWTIDGAAIIEGQKVEITDDETAMASWVAKKYTVTYEPGEGTGTAFTQTITTDIPWTANAENSFHKTGCHQKSWDGAALGASMSTWADMTLTAVYELSTFIISFGDSNKFVKYGDKLGALPYKYLPGKKFVGWFVDGVLVTCDTIYSWDGNVTAVASYKNLKHKLAVAFHIKNGKAYYGAVFRGINGKFLRGAVHKTEEDS